MVVPRDNEMLSARSDEVAAPILVFSSSSLVYPGIYCLYALIGGPRKNSLPRGSVWSQHELPPIDVFRGQYDDAWKKLLRDRLEVKIRIRAIPVESLRML